MRYKERYKERYEVRYKVRYKMRYKSEAKRSEANQKVATIWLNIGQRLAHR